MNKAIDRMNTKRESTKLCHVGALTIAGSVDDLATAVQSVFLQELRRQIVLL